MMIDLSAIIWSVVSSKKHLWTHRNTGVLVKNMDWGKLKYGGGKGGVY